jgi:hypothetical protein
MGTAFEKPSGERVSLVGSEGFVERTKEELGIRARGRKAREIGG